MDLAEGLFVAARQLPIRPREYRWRSVSYCVADAVWSIGARYDAVVAPLVRRVAAAMSDLDPLVVTEDALSAQDPAPLDRFLQRFSDVDQLVGLTNSQRTSSRGGILKAEAMLRYVDVLLANGVRTLRDAVAVSNDLPTAERVSTALRTVPGDGVRTGYFWMLVGSDDTVKPDRQVLKWLANNGQPASVAEAREILVLLADYLSESVGGRVSPWQVDNAIWRVQAHSGSAW